MEGAQAAGTDDSGHVIVASAQVSMGREACVTEAGEYRFFAGWRSDPFFFDVQDMLNHQRFTGDDSLKACCRSGRMHRLRLHAARSFLR